MNLTWRDWRILAWCLAFTCALRFAMGESDSLVYWCLCMMAAEHDR